MDGFCPMEEQRTICADSDFLFGGLDKACQFAFASPTTSITFSTCISC